MDVLLVEELGFAAEVVVFGAVPVDFGAVPAVFGAVPVVFGADDGDDATGFEGAAFCESDGSVLGTFAGRCSSGEGT